MKTNQSYESYNLALFIVILPSAMDVWGVRSRLFQKTVVEDPNFFKVAEIFLQKGSEEDKLLFVRLARKLWFRRNNFVFNGLFHHPNELLKEVKNSMEDFHRSNEMGPETVDNAIEGQMPDRWIAPAMGWHKANWDAARDITKRRMGLGIVIRDLLGRTYGAGHCDKRPVGTSQGCSVHSPARMFGTICNGGIGSLSCSPSVQGIGN